jgi:hypothetical protein
MWAAGHGGAGGGFGRGGGVGFGLPAGRFGGGVPRFSGRGPRFSGLIGMSRTRQHVFSEQNRGIRSGEPTIWIPPLSDSNNDVRKATKISSTLERSAPNQN